MKGIKFMLMTPTTSTSIPFTRDIANALKECDRVSTFGEAGYYLVAGYKDERRVVYAHFADKAAYDSYCSRGSAPSQYDRYRR